MQNMTRAKGDTPFYDQLTPYALAPAGQESGQLRPPRHLGRDRSAQYPAEELPKSGTLRLWIPLPIETDSQRNVTIVSVEPAAYVRSSTGTDADIGLAYLEIPLEDVTGSSCKRQREVPFHRVPSSGL